MKVFLRASAALAVLFSVGVSVGLAQKPEVGVPTEGPMGIRETVADIMLREWSRYPADLGHAIRFVEQEPIRPEREDYDREHLRDRPGGSSRVSQIPPARQNPNSILPLALRGGAPGPYAVGTSFLGIDLNSSGSVPPDSVGDVSPTQVVVLANGRIRAFDKTGVIGTLNADLDVFFSSVNGGNTCGDPQVRFDRLTNKWYVTAITFTSPNRVLLAVSSGATLTGAASFTFFQFQQDLVGTQPNSNTGEWVDYLSLGVDNNALYVGGNMFTAGGNFQGASVFVIRKSSVQGAGPIVVTPFRDIVPPSGASGPVAPRGVDNDDAAATEGYFIGVDAAFFSRLVVRRIGTPGGTPTISGDILINTPTTNFPMAVSTLGSTGPLDALDDRLFQAKMYFNKLTGTRTLWTAHNIEVDATGAANGAGNRNGSRWYQISSLATTPVITQSGTVFSAAGANPSSFWIPSLAMNMQGHAMLGCSTAGLAQRAEIAMAQRFSSDALGTMQAPQTIVTTTFNYNVQTGLQRWGDYSQTCIDPSDGMTAWTFQEYCSAADTWGVRAIELKAPPPATVSSVSQPNLVLGTSNVNVTVTGTSSAGSGFFDPGAGFPRRIAASVSGTGVTVNSVTFTNPTSIVVNLSIAGNAATGARNLTITNPDLQASTLNGAFTVVNPVPTLDSISPDNANAGGPGFTITANGTNFVPTSKVLWNGAELVTTFQNATQLTADVPAANIASPGTADVAVRTPAPGGGTTAARTFTINNTQPQIVLPDAYTVLQGTDRSPGLSKLFNSDNSRLIINVNPLLQYTNLIEEHAVSPFASVSRLSFILESSASIDIRVRHILMKNFTTGLFEEVGSSPNPLTDGTMQVDITTNPNRFIDPTTREMIVRLKFDMSITRPPTKKQTDFIDRGVWELQP